MPDRLDERDHEIWSKYIGGWSQAGLAAEYDVSQQRISQVLSQVRESIPDTARTDAALLARERTNALLAAVWPVTVSFERHMDEQGQSVVDAVVAAVEVLGLGEEQRRLALTAAQAKLLGEE